MELTENLQLVDLLKVVCKRFGHKENYRVAKLYNKNGIQLFQDDLMLLNDGDILYIALKGRQLSLCDVQFTIHACRRGLQLQRYS